MPLVSARLLLPYLDRRLRPESGEQRRQLEGGGCQLLGDALAAHAHLLGGQARLVQCAARRIDLLVERGAARSRLAQQRVELLARHARSLQLRLDLRTQA